MYLQSGASLLNTYPIFPGLVATPITPSLVEKSMKKKNSSDLLPVPFVPFVPVINAMTNAKEMKLYVFGAFGRVTFSEPRFVRPDHVDLQSA